MEQLEVQIKKHAHNFKDLTGQVFGKLTVLSLSHINKNQTSIWLCKCECSKTTKLSAAKLRNGHTKSCGCLQERRYKTAKEVCRHIGEKYHGLTIIAVHGYNGKYIHVLTRCICGNFHTAPLRNILKGKTKSCGCYKKQLNVLQRKYRIHGPKKKTKDWNYLTNKV